LSPFFFYSLRFEQKRKREETEKNKKERREAKKRKRERERTAIESSISIGSISSIRFDHNEARQDSSQVVACERTERERAAPLHPSALLSPFDVGCSTREFLQITPFLAALPCLNEVRFRIHLGYINDEGDMKEGDVNEWINDFLTAGAALQTSRSIRSIGILCPYRPGPRWWTEEEEEAVCSAFIGNSAIECTVRLE
jgi:hypothetical protein